MNTKKTVSIGFIAILLMSFAAILPIKAPDANAIWVDPDYYLGTSVGEEFEVKINVNVSAPAFAGFEFKFQWNNTLLEIVGNSIVISCPWSPNFIAKNTTTTDVVPGIDQHWVAASLLAPATPVTGVYTLFKLEFRVRYQPYFPEADGSSVLDLVDTKISDAASPPNPINHTPYDGLYEIEAVTPPPPKIMVDPTDYSPALGQLFNVTIKITDLAPALNLWGWEAKLEFNETHKDAIAAYEGPFLKGFAGVGGTFFVYVLHPGYVHMAGLLVGNHTAPFGGGIVAYVTFNETYETLYPDVQTSVLGLYDTKMADTEANPPPDGIPHTVANGTNHVPFRKLGRAIDCFTDPYRKYGYKHYTSFIGMFPQVNADAYEPQDEVTLYALVTYADDPVQNKLVQFEIHTPNDVPIEGFPLFRVAMTDESGIATITFRIPVPCDDPERVLGKWYCYQSVEIACQKVVDELWFEVGWTIWLLNVEVTNAKKCTNATITVEYKNIAVGPFYENATAIYVQEACGPVFKGYYFDTTQQPPAEWKRVYFTVVLYDDLGVPIGQDTLWLDVPTGEYCHPYYGNFTMNIHIPKWAFLGEGTAYVNAYTDICSLCGMPYCPEIETSFPIEKQ
jgi:hypothetical protein